MLPEELKALPQWVCAAANKIPLNPTTGAAADVTEPSTWGTYEVAVNAGYPHIGFVLTAGDPYCIIDLDAPESQEQADRHSQILSAFPSYAEYSQSGRGIHIISRGSIPRGVRRDKVEVYSTARYMICTGNLYRNAPITDCQETLNQLFQEMDRASQSDGNMVEVDATLPDKEVIRRATSASNAEKFNALCRGEWASTYPSQSEADFALLSMLAFYTKSNEQVRRLFRLSKLGQRSKAQRDDYLDRSLTRIRASEPPPVQFSLPEPKRPDNKATATPYPPGFVGTLARYITETSLRPVPEIGTAAALALMAGVVGRQYNVSGTGLNLYLIFLAKTGTGKEGATTGIDRILKAVRPTVPLVDNFIGPGTFASGQAIIRSLDEQPCCVAVLGEFGLMLQTLSDANSTAHSLVMRRVLLDLYGKSGVGSMLRPSVYSDKEKNTKLLSSPALTLLGESTPEAFYSGLSEGNIAEGLIPRFLVIEYQGDRPPRNPAPFQEPQPDIVQHFSDVLVTALQMAANGAVAHIGMDPEAEIMLDEFDRLCDARIRGGNTEGVRQLWNRAHFKALRICGILAAATNPADPVVNAVEAAWAIQLVQRDVALLLDRFEEGNVGEGDNKQVAETRRVVREFMERPYQDLLSYGVTRAMHAKGVIPYVYLFRRLASLAAFRKDRRGAKMAIRNAIEVQVMSGELIELEKQEINSAKLGKGSMFVVPAEEQTGE